MLFSDFAKKLEILEGTQSRLVITDDICGILKDFSKEEIIGGTYLLLGRLAPAYQNLEFSLGWKMIVRSITKLSELKEENILKSYKNKGDLGDVIMGLPEDLFSKEKLTVGEVYKKLAEIALYSGEGSQDKKVDGLAKLLLSVDQLSAKYIARVVMGKLRLGFSDKTILDALSVLERGDKGARKKLDEAYQILPDAGLLAKKVIESGLERTLSTVEVEVGVPVIPALCQRLNHASEIIEKMEVVAVERKYDGTRVQIHFNRKGFENERKYKTYTRNLEENSHMFPELSGLTEYLNCESCVMDCEAVGIDPKTDKLMPFQMTITRKRKHGIAELADSVPLRFFVFDILSLNGKTLLSLPYWQRREILDKTVLKNKVVVIDESIQTNDPVALHGYHEKFLSEGYEGAVIKKWDGSYLPGRQGWNWVKIKESEGSSGKLSDTLDLVIMGYYRGRGKRSGFGIGAFLTGIVKDGKYLTLAKIGTGLSDEDFRSLKKKLDPLVVKEMPKQYVVDGSLEADVWVEPRVVVEVAADEITISPSHSAGVALRFPRMIKIRDDKGPEQSSTLEEIMSIRK